MGDFTYSLMQYLINLSSHYANSEAFSQLKEKSILYIYPIFLLLSSLSIRTLDISETILIIVCCMISFTEGYSIKEDVSLRKFLMRIIFIILVIITVIILIYFNCSTSLLKLFLFGLFYLLTSCAYQSYELFFKHLHVSVDETIFNQLK
jgi:uncharacterized membrane protein